MRRPNRKHNCAVWMKMGRVHHMVILSSFAQLRNISSEQSRRVWQDGFSPEARAVLLTKDDNEKSDNKMQHLEFFQCSSWTILELDLARKNNA